MVKSNKSKSKKSKLEVYTDKIFNEINEKAILLAKPITQETDIIKIDDDVKPILLVISSDILNGNHQTAIDTAAVYKLSTLGIKAYNSGMIDSLPSIDLTNIVTNIQGALLLLPTISAGISSLIECVGKNIKQCNNDVIFQYGLAMHLGANIANQSKTALLQEVGISIGNISLNINKEASYQKFKELVKSLPNNKHRKRLIELVNKIYNEEKTESSETIKKEQTSPIYDEGTPEKIKFNETKD